MWLLSSMHRDVFQVHPCFVLFRKLKSTVVFQWSVKALHWLSSCCEHPPGVSVCTHVFNSFDIERVDLLSIELLGHKSLFYYFPKWPGLWSSVPFMSTMLVSLYPCNHGHHSRHGMTLPYGFGLFTCSVPSIICVCSFKCVANLWYLEKQQPLNLLGLQCCLCLLYTVPS